ncbi:hypothetical protein BGY98DRAFT_984803 [Russula aff. rugulosa BPL654]|nr:hypothetical protein BGY98DRAFT_984803 [Russula aff. rugulosa BPL654]
MFLYSLTFSLVVLPLTIARWLLFSTFSHHHLSPAPTFFASLIFHLSCATNATRRAGNATDSSG